MPYVMWLWACCGHLSLKLLLEIKNIEQIKKDINNFFSINEDARFVRRLDIIALICNRHQLNFSMKRSLM